MSKHILVVDDDSAILDSIQLILEQEHYHVVTCSDGRVTAHLKETQPDLLLLDIWMGTVDGREICKRIKTDETTKHIPVIMISASREIIKNSQDSGADDYLAKPFDIEDLLDKVTRYTTAKKQSS